MIRALFDIVTAERFERRAKPPRCEDYCLTDLFSLAGGDAAMLVERMIDRREFLRSERA